jgi:peptidyl-prolyl cis-trans isomerase A (cyclophilin A)
MRRTSRVSRISMVTALAIAVTAQACHMKRAGELEDARVHTRVRVETSKGTFVLDVNRAWAPRGADRFLELVRSRFFDDSRFFRVREKYIAQFGIAGDPAVTRLWKDRYFPDDSVRTSNVRATFAFAMTGPNLRNTQVYVNLTDNRQLDAQGFSPVGRVVEGMDVVDRLYSGYGEDAGGGLRLGRQDRMFNEGNAHLDAAFPKLDKLIRATVVP